MKDHRAPFARHELNIRRRRQRGTRIVPTRERREFAVQRDRDWGTCVHRGKDPVRIPRNLRRIRTRAGPPCRRMSVGTEGRRYYCRPMSWLQFLPASPATGLSPIRMRWTVVRLSSALKTSRPSAFRRWPRIETHLNRKERPVVLRSRRDQGGGRQRERRPGSARLHFQCPIIHFLTVEPLDRRLGLRDDD